MREICSGKVRTPRGSSALGPDFTSCIQITIEQTTLDAAKSSLVYGIAQSVSTPGAAANMAFVSETLRGMEITYGRKMLETLQVRGKFFQSI